jgi:hypothetical protein
VIEHKPVTLVIDDAGGAAGGLYYMVSMEVGAEIVSAADLGRTTYRKPKVHRSRFWSACFSGRMPR